jgi:hypothetical protein
MNELEDKFGDGEEQPPELQLVVESSSTHSPTAATNCAPRYSGWSRPPSSVMSLTRSTRPCLGSPRTSPPQSSASASAS